MLKYSLIALSLILTLNEANAKPENADGVSDKDYFALFEQVVNKIIPYDNHSCWY